MSTLPDIAIIGPGKVGTAVGVLAARAGWKVCAVAGRRPEHASAAAQAIGHGARACAPAEAAAAAGMVLLTVSDEAIEPVCRDLAAAGAFRKGAVVAHFCGAMDSTVLAPARDRCACQVGSLHPVQTFPTAQAAIERFPGTWCFIEGDPEAVAALERLAEALGGRPARVNPGGKPFHHAAAVMACNYLAALLDAALDLEEQAGVDRPTAWSALEPLVRATLDNIAAMGPAQALTGPIARGDADTVRRHLDALRDDKTGLAVLYRALGGRAVQLALKKGTLRTDKAVQLLEALAGKTHRPAP